MPSPDSSGTSDSGKTSTPLVHLSSRDVQVFNGKRISVAVQEWQDSRNRIYLHETVLFGEGVAIVPVVGEKILLIRQFRPSVNGSILEIPAGKVDPGEDLLAAAQRELSEETGVVGGHLSFLTSIRTTPGFCNERIHLFLSTEGRLEDSHPEEGEAIEEILLLRPEDVQKKIRSGDITDAKSLVALFLVLEKLGLSGSP
ncbi:ADP-ribose pyrophosphatase [Leptospirillum ferriphilum]|jgi:ADP-ribose pyrophosphatase|uniref:GDP-mannose pyrophosphatase n=3 Tax=Leptospirillum TaxID=179 RepID=A0A094WA44_9BACT|nr:NUDIX hydrolase [Leptospirillum ferriphilum]AFS54150.1 putative ADP-ribose pyrophosphatase [Leptospirillum ferriphilum ML-04]EDZ38021.1 MAG: Putative ADP-ribose pyrophosphatase [Leptospirillum sp. Group II '5-way CG']KGA93395.1 ADP-ribose pyrophosphatase [Leptospirillum ferriphilum]MCL5259123.1 NUDIX hydrolase [Nitrospirota bacterium]